MAERSRKHEANLPHNTILLFSYPDSPDDISPMIIGNASNNSIQKLIQKRINSTQRQITTLESRPIASVDKTKRGRGRPHREITEILMRKKKQRQGEIQALEEKIGVLEGRITKPLIIVHDKDGKPDDFKVGEFRDPETRSWWEYVVTRPSIAKLEKENPDKFAAEKSWWKFRQNNLEINQYSPELREHLHRYFEIRFLSKVALSRPVQDSAEKELEILFTDHDRLSPEVIDSLAPAMRKITNLDFAKS